MPLSDYQAELNSITIGAGTDYQFETAIEGLGIATPRTSDLPLPTGGVYGGRDLPDVRTITLAIAILGDDPDDVMDLVAALLTAWAPTSTDTTLDICLPGMGTVRWTGRPRGVDLDLAALPLGNTARARLVFVALDPTGVPV